MNLSDIHYKEGMSGLRKLAKKAGTDPIYLYQLATCWRAKRPSPDLAMRLVKADKRLNFEELLFPPCLKSARRKAKKTKT